MIFYWKSYTFRIVNREESLSTHIRPEWAKELLFHSLPLPLSNGGLSFFCPLRGRIPAASNSPGAAPGLTYQCPIRGVNLPLIPPRPLSSTSEATSSITPREGSVDSWGKYGLKGQKQVSPRQRLGNCSQPTFAQNGQKNYYFTHSLCHSAVVGCYSFAPFGGVSLLHPLPPGVARGWHINAPSGRN